jgi:lipopolysaccharide/colanic/teichoic acid biosynthesis glycosyltransferase/ribosomal protein S18 acetylase RimI-like enzyme
MSGRIGAVRVSGLGRTPVTVARRSPLTVARRSGGMGTLSSMGRDVTDGAGVEFRIVGPGDAPVLLDLLEGIDRAFFRPHPFTLAEAERIASHTGRDVYGMLMDGDRAVAYGLLRGLDEGYATPAVGVAVRSDMQGRGLARATMIALQAEGRARGAEGVRLRVHADNARARRLYESLGYAYRGEERGELVMVLPFQAEDTSGAQMAPDVPRGRRVRMPRRVGLALKRAMDIGGAALALVLLSPILAWVALALVLTQGRPILFRQGRPGRGGRIFTIVKFRTMRAAAPGEVWYLTDTVRMTRLGRFLRATSIDELPELWNVLRGEMSLVGPRPLLAEYLESYTPGERRRHDMRPGVTSWAAVNGRHVLGFKERLLLDTWYVDHWSLALDLRILALTVRQVIRGTDVSTAQDMAAVGFPLPGVGTPVEGERVSDDHPAPS